MATHGWLARLEVCGGKGRALWRRDPQIPPAGRTGGAAINSHQSQSLLCDPALSSITDWSLFRPHLHIACEILEQISSSQPSIWCWAGYTARTCIRRLCNISSTRWRLATDVDQPKTIKGELIALNCTKTADLHSTGVYMG